MEEKRGLKFFRFVLNLAIAIFFIVVYLCNNKHIKFETVFNITILTSFCVVFIIDMLSDLFFYWCKNKTEDKTKLSSDYIKLNKKYKDDKYTFKNSENKNSLKLLRHVKLDKNEPDKFKFTFPIIYECDLRNKTIKFDDIQNMYNLPSFVAQNASKLMEAHSTSDQYNSLTIRIKNWYTEGNIFQIEPEFTTYYNTLLTNRCMDFEIQKNISVREILEYGPYLSPLSESKLSNHLGFNAFVKTSDNWIPLIRRKTDLTDGKRTYGLSVQASIKTKYILNEEHKIKEQNQLFNCMKKEIVDELGVTEGNIYNDDHCIYAAYRDIREGGKPHLFAFFNLTITKETLTKCFNKNIKNKKHDDNLLYDGKTIYWIKADTNIESQIAISPKMIIYNNKKLLMTPSAATCVAFAMDFGLLK
jgi:hypothetical protein